MTPPDLPPANRQPVEKKVTWAAIGTYLGGVALLAVCTAVGSDPGLISGLPDWLESLLLPLVPAAVSFLGGYTAKHTPRPDLAPGAADKGNTGEGTVYRSPFDKPGGSDPYGP